MACTKSSKITRWQTQLDKHEAELAILDVSISKAYTEIEQYKLDTNEGSQQVKYRDIEKMQKSQRYLQGQIDYLQTKICGQGLTRISLKRRGFIR